MAKETSPRIHRARQIGRGPFLRGETKCLARVENPAGAALYSWGLSLRAKVEGSNDIDQPHSTCSQIVLADPPEQDRNPAWRPTDCCEARFTRLREAFAGWAAGMHRRASSSIACPRYAQAFLAGKAVVLSAGTCDAPFVLPQSSIDHGP